MIASHDVGACVTPQVKAPKKRTRELTTIDQGRIDRLSQTEVSFIPNEQFTQANGVKLEEPSSLGPSPFASEIELGRFSFDEKAGSGLPAHLARLCSTPLLSHADERDLFKRMNFLKFRGNALRSRLSRFPELADEVESCLLKAERLRNHLIQANTRLVMSIARRFADNRNSFDDLLSQGVASLMHAVDKFDFERGYRFSTYATCAVRRDLYRLVMSRKRDQERFSTGASEQLGAEADFREPWAPNAEADWLKLSDAVRDMLEELDDRERFIVARRYGLVETGKKASYSRLGESLGISKERVRQLANRAMEKLRDSASEKRLDLLLG